MDEFRIERVCHLIISDELGSDTLYSIADEFDVYSHLVPSWEQQCRIATGMANADMIAVDYWSWQIVMLNT